MGNRNNKHGDSSDDDTILVDKSLLQRKLNMPELNTDAAVSKAQQQHLPSITVLSSEQCAIIVDRLDVYEKVSLIFLLVLDDDDAFELMQRVIQSPQDDHEDFAKFLQTFAHIQSETMKLIEALCAIQNYSILKSLGHSKAELIAAFNPLTPTVAIRIDKTRKLLFCVAEKMTKEMQQRLLDGVEKDLRKTSPESLLPQLSTFPHLEMCFVYLFKHNYVTLSNFKLLCKHLKALDLVFEAELLASKAHQVEEEEEGAARSQYSDIHESGVSLNTDKAVEGGDTSRLGRTVVRRSGSMTNTVYPMDDDHPGIVLIMENISFYEDPDPRFKDRLVETDTALEMRQGSEKDSTRLIRIFERFGYTIVHERDRTHLQMIAIIRKVAHYQFTQQQSSFVLIFLSHGLQNQIIGCNSVPLHTDDIKEAINSKALENKPKILIYQACQGSKVQTIPLDITTDGISNSTMSTQPSQAHIFELWPTVPGYVSYRSRSEGTWMIQSLCDNLEKYPEESISDICVRVNSDIGKRQWLGRENGRDVCKVMVSNCNTTLQKRFFFPTLKAIGNK